MIWLGWLAGGSQNTWLAIGLCNSILHKRRCKFGAFRPQRRPAGRPAGKKNVAPLSLRLAPMRGRLLSCVAFALAFHFDFRFRFAFRQQMAARFYGMDPDNGQARRVPMITRATLIKHLERASQPASERARAFFVFHSPRRRSSGQRARARASFQSDLRPVASHRPLDLQ